MKVVKLEEKHQAALVSWFRAKFPKYEKLLFIIANGENIGAQRMHRLKQLGLVPGIPDLFLSIAREGYNGFYIEMKKPTGHLQQNQVDVHKELKKQKYKVETCYGWDEARNELERYLAEDIIFRM